MEAVINKMEYELGSFAGIIEKRLRSIEEEHINERIWKRDATLWKDDEESTQMISNSLGWLDAASKMASAVPAILQFVREVQEDGFTHVVVMGMGGSSLAPQVFERIFGTGKNGLKLSIIDTTDPASIQAIEQKVPLEKTIFIVASKSGVTAETNALGDYFYEKMKVIKAKKAGSHFVAITDPGSPLVEKARRLHYRHIFSNFEGISTHYSVLSYFGMVPAALMGIDVEALLQRAIQMQQNCQMHNTPSENPALKHFTALLGIPHAVGRQFGIISISYQVCGHWIPFHCLAKILGIGNPDFSA
jgi:glucose-6-phosphate isomerase